MQDGKHQEEGEGWVLSCSALCFGEHREGGMHFKFPFALTELR